MRRHGPAIWGRGVLLLALWSAAAPGQSRETLETKVTGAGSVVHLEWSSKHLWDAELSASPPMLFAEYRLADGRRVTDCLGGAVPGGCGAGVAGRGDAARRRLRYDLPEQLAQVPAGPVCLFFAQVNARLLPLRRESSTNDRTRFRHEPWEARAKAGIARTSRDNLQARLRDSLRLMDGLIEAARARSQRNGGETLARCEAIPVPRLGEAGGARRAVAGRGLEEPIARRVCVMQAWFADSIVRSAAGKLPATRVPPFSPKAAPPPPVLKALLALVPATMQARIRAVRGPQLDEYAADWNLLSAGIVEFRRELQRSGKDPYFGGFDDYLAVQTAAGDAGARIRRALQDPRGVPDSIDVAGYIGSAVEAYSTCVADGIDQLRTVRTADTRLQARYASLNERIRGELVRRCTVNVQRLDGLVALRARFADRLAAAVADSAAGIAGEVRETSSELNRRECTP